MNSSTYTTITPFFFKLYLNVNIFSARFPFWLWRFNISLNNHTIAWSGPTLHRPITLPNFTYINIKLASKLTTFILISGSVLPSTALMAQKNNREIANRNIFARFSREIRDNTAPRQSAHLNHGSNKWRMTVQRFFPISQFVPRLCDFGSGTKLTWWVEIILCKGIYRDGGVYAIY